MAVDAALNLNDAFWIAWLPPLVAAVIGVVGAGLAAWFGVAVGAKLTRSAHAQSVKETTLIQARHALALQLNRLEMNSGDFDRAAEAIPLLYGSETKTLKLYALYWTEGRSMPMGSSGVRRALVDSMLSDIIPDAVRPHKFSDISAAYKAADPQNPVDVFYEQMYPSMKTPKK